MSQAVNERCGHGLLRGLCVCLNCSHYDGQGVEAPSERPKRIAPAPVAVVPAPEPARLRHASSVRREEYLARRRKRRTDPTTSPLRRRALRFAQLVGDEFDVATDDMLSQLRYRELALPRMVLFWLCRESTSPQWSYPGIGHALARDHTTVMSACRKVRQLRESDLDMRDRLDRLSAAVEAVEKGKG